MRSSPRRPRTAGGSPSACWCSPRRSPRPSARSPGPSRRRQAAPPPAGGAAAALGALAGARGRRAGAPLAGGVALLAAPPLGVWLGSAWVTLARERGRRRRELLAEQRRCDRGLRDARHAASDATADPRL